ncbi:hypothetical protein C8T65DRAFT_751082 [Cerioporus squamosus]|nr:hypothetical protein C8T65DRAFT_751082 [Cerioporus squamosus]
MADAQEREADARERQANAQELDSRSQARSEVLFRNLWACPWESDDDHDDDEQRRARELMITPVTPDRPKISFLCTIDRLPAELLILIFTWRDLAIGDPTLWTRTDNKHPDQLQAFLQRSNRAPVSLHLNTRDGHLDTIVRAAGCRIRRLDLTVLPGASDTLPLVHERIPTDSLECFTISHSRALQRPPDLSLHPVLLFGEKVSPLRALAIHGQPIWIPANSFPRLTHLYLGFQTRGQDPAQVMRILELLRNAPQVMFVDIYNVDGQSTPPGDTRRVPLLHVRHFCIAYTAMDVAFALLSHLDLSQHARTHLDVFVCRPTFPPIPPLRSVEAMRRLEVVAEGENLRVVAEGPYGGLWIDVRFNTMTGAGHRLDTWLSAIYTSLPLQHVTSLHLSLGDHASLVPALMDHCPAVSEIRMVADIQYEKRWGDPSRSAVRALYACLREMACPGLCEISVDVAAGIYPISPEIHSTLLAHVLARRMEAGQAVPLVNIQPFAGCRWSKPAMFENVEAQFLVLTDFKEARLLPPGPFLSTFLERLPWYTEGTEEYWDVEDGFKPEYW